MAAVRLLTYMVLVIEILNLEFNCNLVLGNWNFPIKTHSNHSKAN
jgi:hypothetical protein